MGGGTGLGDKVDDKGSKELSVVRLAKGRSSKYTNVFLDKMF